MGLRGVVVVLLALPFAGCTVAPWDPCAMYYGSNCAYYGGLTIRTPFDRWDAGAGAAALRALGFANVTGGVERVTGMDPDDPRAHVLLEARPADCGTVRCPAGTPHNGSVLDLDLSGRIEGQEPRSAIEAKAAAAWSAREAEVRQLVERLEERTGWRRTAEPEWQAQLVVH